VTRLMADLDPESLLAHCVTRNCDAVFVPSQKQINRGSGAKCPDHRCAYRGCPRYERKVYQLKPREVVCDGCGVSYIAKPQALVQQKLLHAKLLCEKCCQRAQHATSLMCPCCAIIIKPNQTLVGCLVGGCPALPVEVRRKTIPALIASPFSTRLWSLIIARSLSYEKPEQYRREVVAKRAVRGPRRGKKQRWGKQGRVVWREQKT
jgi:hypothetical protein